mgnify:CR=1 FL=1
MRRTWELQLDHGHTEVDADYIAFEHGGTVSFYDRRESPPTSSVILPDKLVSAVPPGVWRNVWEKEIVK